MLHDVPVQEAFRCKGDPVGIPAPEIVFHISVECVSAALDDLVMAGFLLRGRRLAFGVVHPFRFQDVSHSVLRKQRPVVGDERSSDFGKPSFVEPLGNEIPDEEIRDRLLDPLESEHVRPSGNGGWDVREPFRFKNSGVVAHDARGRRFVMRGDKSVFRILHSPVFQENACRSHDSGKARPIRHNLLDQVDAREVAVRIANDNL